MGTESPDSIMRALLVLSSIFLCQSFGQECSPPLPAECADTEIRCDMGTNGGCWMGDYCMQEGDYCPPPRHTPLPSQCMEGEVACDMGTDGNCWRGDYCIPEGDYCPPPCHSPLPVQCTEGDIACDTGSYGGCWS